MTMAWCFPEEATPYTEAVFNLLAVEHQILVPELWFYEVASVLVGAVRRKRITSAEAREFFTDLEAIQIVVDDASQRAFQESYALAEQHGLTGYDAAYLELAMRKGLPLASLDNDLNKAARAVGVPLVQP